MSNIPLKIFQSLFKSVLTYFIITSAVWGFVYLVPSVLALSGASLYFSLLGITGLAALFALPINIAEGLSTVPEYAKNIITFIIISSLIITPVVWAAEVTVPFFISILCGASPFIATSLLSLSAVNISVLVICALDFLSNIPAIFIVSTVYEPLTTVDPNPSANQKFPNPFDNQDVLIYPPQATMVGV